MRLDISIVALVSCLLSAGPAIASDLSPLEPGRVTLEAEGQVVWQARNDAAIQQAEDNLNSYSESTCGRSFITGEG